MPENISGGCFYKTDRILFIVLRIHGRLSTILKASKKVYEVMFFDVKKYVYSESALNTIYININHKC